MLCKELMLNSLNPRLPKTQNEAVLQLFIRDVYENFGPQKYPAIVLCPGGGYHFTSDREAEAVALQFVAAGYSVFCLRYSCAPDRYPTQLLQLAATISYVRENAEEYHIDAKRIAVCGFSAGAHLAASSGILWKEPFIADTLGIPYASNRPDAMILSYPVISGVRSSHTGSFMNLLGEGASEEALLMLSLEMRVDADTVPAFIWHTYDDAVVPVENSLLLANSLRAAGVPFELHIYPHGPHGMSLCNEQTKSVDRPDQSDAHVATWMRLCMEWLERLK